MAQGNLETSPFKLQTHGYTFTTCHEDSRPRKILKWWEICISDTRLATVRDLSMAYGGDSFEFLQRFVSMNLYRSSENYRRMKRKSSNSNMRKSWSTACSVEDWDIPTADATSESWRSTREGAGNF
ncbi:hypothetical protein LINGRAHAP2_LOCUS13610 [Linum grandiflorum]